MNLQQFIIWLKEETEYGDWHPNVQKEVEDKLKKMVKLYIDALTPEEKNG